MTWLEGKLLGFDLEATGTDPLTARPVSFALAYFDSGACTRVRHGLIHPGIPIPADSTKVHHITDEMVDERGGDLERSVVGIAGELYLASSEGTPVVGMNLRYDLSVIDQRLRAIEEEPTTLREIGWKGPVIDALVLDRQYDKYRKGHRTLGDLCAHYGVPTGQSHAAGDDAVAAVNVCLAIARKHAEVRDGDLSTLTWLQRQWQHDWLMGYNEYRVKQGKKPVPESEGDWPLFGDRFEPYHVDLEEQRRLREGVEAPF